MISNGNISLLNHHQFLGNLNLMDKSQLNNFFFTNSSEPNSYQKRNCLNSSTNGQGIYQGSNIINNNQMKQLNNMSNRQNANYNRNSNGNYSFTINLNNTSSCNNNNSSSNNNNNTIGNNLNKSNISNEGNDGNNNTFSNDSFANKQPYFLEIYEISKILSQSVWRILIIFLDKIKKCEFLFQNTNFNSKIFIFITKILKDGNLNIPLHQSLIETFPFLIKYGMKSEKDEINRIIIREIFESKSFYARRLFFPYFQSALKVFSVSFLIHNHTMDNFLKLLDDNKLFQVKCISMIKNFYPILVNDTKIKNHVANKLEEIKRIIPIDFEVKRVIE